MQTGIVGLPLAGKTSLFKILTHAHLDARAAHAPTHVGVAQVPDPRLDKLAELYRPRKITHAAVQYVDVGGLAHVVRVFENTAVPHAAGKIDPLRDVESLELELMLTDLDQATRRIERIEKDLKRKKEPALEQELALLNRCRISIEAERPLRELEFSAEEQKLLTSFMFLSHKPMLYVLNLGDAEAAELLAAYGLKESGLDRLIHATYKLLGLISFFTCGEPECRAWMIRRGTSAL